MRALRIFLWFLTVVALAGCVNAPSLEMATGGITPAQVASRVKCELADAFADKIDHDPFKWMETWTVRADLILQASAQAGLSPSVVYVRNYGNAYNFAAGPNTFNGTAIPAISQFLNFGAAAGVSDQAIRTELISFTVSLKELKSLWKDRRDNPSRYPECRAAERGGLGGNLGLAEWVEASLQPVGTRGTQLAAGYHPAPNGSSLPRAPSAPAVSRYLAEGPSLTRDAATLNNFCSWKENNINENNIKFTDENGNTTDSSYLYQVLQRIKAILAESGADGRYNGTHVLALAYGAEIEIDNAISTLKALARLSKNYEKILIDEDVRAHQKHWKEFVSVMARRIKQCNFRYIGKPIEQAEMAVEKVTLDPGTGGDNLEQASAIKKAMCGGYSSDSVSKVTSAVWQFELAESNVKELLNEACNIQYNAGTTSFSKTYQQIMKDLSDARQALPDPPIDSISHSVQFVVTYGGSVSPLWTLAVWKGPAQSGPLASVGGGRQHILNIAAGPADKADSTRLLTNLNVLQALQR